MANYIKTDGHSKTAEVGVEVQLIMEGDCIVAYCPALNLSSFDTTEEDAKTAFDVSRIQGPENIYIIKIDELKVLQKRDLSVRYGYFALLRNDMEDLNLAIASANFKIDEYCNLNETLLIAAVAANQLNAVKSIINAGADINKKSKYGSTPLMVAAERGHTEIAQNLIDGQADTSIANNYGFTPGWYAAYYHEKAGR